MRIRELIDTIEGLADPRLAAGWDKSGLQIAGTRQDCRRLAMALDPLPGVVEQALDWGADCLLVHHPLLLSPRLPDRLDDYHKVLSLVLSRGAWLYAAHTSLDVRTDGPAGWLAEALDLRRRRVLEPAGSRPYLQTRLRLADTAERDKALAVLAGRARCQVLPLTDTVCDLVHPGPAWPGLRFALAEACPGLTVVSRLALTEPVEVYGYGLVGELPEPLPFDRLRDRLLALLPRGFCTQAGQPPETVTHLAYCPGSGADMAGRAFAAGAQVHVTGDLKYHQATAVPPGRCVLDVGHFSLEEVMMRAFARELAETWGESGPLVRLFPGNDPFSAYVPAGALPAGTE